MQNLISTISYIIHFRATNTERTSALDFVLKKLREYFPELEILVVEQDSDSKMHFDDELNIKHIFIKNSGAFNKSWASNVGVKNTNKEILVFGDSDLFLEKDDYISCFEAASNFEAITPNKREAINISISPDKPNEIEIINKRPLYTFAGGLVIMTREGYLKSGSWDERFEGWGGEDAAMSHVIYNKLTSKSFDFPLYHIDHPRSISDGNQQTKYIVNRNLAEEINTFNGRTLEHYIQVLEKSNNGAADKYEKNSQFNSDRSAQKVQKLKFVLAITTYNRLAYLQQCVDSFLQSKNNDYDWQLVIADDGSTDGTKNYLEKLQKEQDAIIILNDRVGIHRQVNTILKSLSQTDFDLCFKCDDDIVFQQKGWDDLYWKIIERTGYEHLIFYDKNWRPTINRSRPIKHGELISNCLPENIQGSLYTFTKSIIEEIGYFDEQQFGKSGFGHVDFSFRCCRAGFNILEHPFDVVGSNNYIQLQQADGYAGSISSKYKSLFNSKEVIEAKMKLAKTQRIFIPYNENTYSINGSDDGENTISKSATWKSSNIKFTKADATFYPERGIIGFFGFLVKRFYNLGISSRMYFIPRGIKKLGRLLSSIGIDLMNIDG